ncbi:MAG: EamA family transporter [Actinobacteria bacterium]|jgi:drug/metabolite transporter (DMT)-like permease|nr:EamA family transporter [Actinomycetota bacterium]MBT3746394.1 EamA family transporter [Actinomycetota bacterium]MBT3970032.1 EamA family transporter [Actinomycetota bacterium]MBT4303388.1 EamA family transporter [Actinomycetota bacterium]MBT6969721.1 EamA family transporter [Actinomycetota bacterium]
MSTSAIALVLVSAVLHAGWNAYLHKLPDPQVVIALSYLSVGVVLLPVAVTNPPSGVWWFVLASIVAHAIYQWMLGSAYGEGSLGVAYPISRGTAPLLVGIGGWMLLGEKPSPFTAVGLVVLVAGLLLLAGVGWRLAERRAVVMALISGLATVGYSLLDAEAVDRTHPLGYLSVVSVVGATVVLVLRRPSVDRLRQAFAPGLLVGVGQGGAYGLILLAFQRAQAGQVAGLRQVSILLGVFLAGEALGRRAWWGAALVAGGAFLVVW